MLVFNELYIQEITCHFALEEEQHENMKHIRIKYRGGVNENTKSWVARYFQKHKSVKFSLLLRFVRDMESFDRQYHN